MSNIEKIMASLGLLCMFSPVFAWATQDVAYVQAVRADLKETARMDAPKIMTLKRGQQVDLFEKQGIWVRVKVREKEGWISRLFLSKHKPVGNADLDKDITTSLEKVSRRRSSSYTVSAAARGLMTSERGRQGREMYRSDFDALEKLETFEISRQAIDNFTASAKLNQD